jgi:polysaccharide biosynthesis protein PslG
MKSKLNIFVYSTFLVLIIVIFCSVFFIPFSKTNNSPSLSSEQLAELSAGQAPTGMRTGHFETPAKPMAVLGAKIEKGKTKTSVKIIKTPVKKTVVKKIVKQKTVPAKKVATAIKQVKAPAKKAKVTAKVPVKQAKAPLKQAVAKQIVSVLKLNLNSNSFIVSSSSVGSLTVKAVSEQIIPTVASGKIITSPVSGGRVSSPSSGGSVSSPKASGGGSGGGGGGGSSPAPTISAPAPAETIPVIEPSAPISSPTSSEITLNSNFNQNASSSFLNASTSASNKIASSSLLNEQVISSSSNNFISSSTVTINYNYGLSMGESLSWMDDVTLNATLDNFTSLGVGWVRMDFNWASIQSYNESSYDWGSIDRVVSAAKVHDLEILPILAYTPSWARPSGCNDEKCAPADSAKFAAFAAEAAKRYAPLGIHTWEIWNEPNISMFWQPAPDAYKYSNLLISASVAIKIQDAQTKIITGGLSPADTSGLDISPIDFLSRIYQNSAGPFFDAVGMHPYTYPFLATDHNPWSAWLQMFFTKPSLRDIMTQNGDSGKQIWLTEFGAPTGGPGLAAAAATNNFSAQYDHVSESLQAQTISDAIGNHKTLSFAGPLFWYSLKDIGTASTTNENFFGLIRYDGSTKPAFDIFKSLISVE